MNKKSVSGSSKFFSETYAFFRGNFWLCLIFGAFITLPFSVFDWIALPIFSKPDIYQQPDFIRTAIGGILGFLAAFSIATIFFLALICRIHKSVLGKSTSFFDELCNGLEKIFAALWIGFLAFFWVFGGLLLFIIPGIIIGTRLMLASYVLVVENEGGLDALLRSRKLVRGYTFEVLKRWLIVYLPIIVFSIVGYFVETSIPQIYQVANTAVGIIYTPFIAAYGYFLYREMVSL